MSTGPAGVPLRVLIVSASMGAGHTGISGELARQLAERGHRSRTVDFLDALPAAYGPAMRAIYRGQLRYAPWTYDAMYRLRFRYPHLWGEINAWYVLLSRRTLLRWVKEAEADVVLSVYPLASAVLGELRRRGRLPVPVLTYITDLGVHPLWVSSGVDLHLTVHPEAAGQAARRAGGAACTCAPLVGGRFLDTVDRQQARARLGLNPDRPLALVVAGSWGVGRVDQTVEAVAAAGFHPITVCGADPALRRRVAALGHGAALGWTDDMPTWMAAVDVLVENAGGLSSMEAFAVGLPVVTYLPIAGHGRHNAREMERAGLSVWAKTPAELAEVLGRLKHARQSDARSDVVARGLFATQQVSAVIEMVRASTSGQATAASDGGVRIVVTGGAGGAGAALVDALVGSGQQVAVVDHRVPHRADVTYWAVDPLDVDGLVMATAGVDTVYHVPDSAGQGAQAAATLWKACRHNGVRQAVVVNPAPGRAAAVEGLVPGGARTGTPDPVRPPGAVSRVESLEQRVPPEGARTGRADGMDRAGTEGARYSPASPVDAAPSASGAPAERLAATFAGTSLVVLVVAALVPAPGTSVVARLIAALTSAVAAGAAWLVARRAVLRVPTVVGAGGTLVALWLLSQSAGGLSTIASGVLLGFFVGVPLARLPAARGRCLRRVAVAASAAVLLVALVADPALLWLIGALAVSGPAAILADRTLSPRYTWRRAWWRQGATAAALAATAVLATWVGANSAGAALVHHGSRRSQAVAITFNGVSDTATVERLLGVLDASGIRATFFLPTPALRAAPQVGSRLLAHDQLLAEQASPRDLGAWLDPHYRGLTRARRVFARQVGVCPAFVRTADNEHPPMMVAAVHRHGMIMITSDVNPRGDVDPALLARQVLAQVRPGSIIALQLDVTGAGERSDASAVVDAVPRIVAGLRARNLRPVPLDQLLHVPAYTGHC